MSNAKIIGKVITIYEEKLYTEENIQFLTEMIDRNDVDLRIMSTRFFRYCPSDYAIASILASDDNRIEHLKNKIIDEIPQDRLLYLEDLIPQF